MALDATEAYTIGGLDNSSRGLGTRIFGLSGEIVGLDGTGTYTVSNDGVVTATGGGADADLVLDDGAGCILTVTAYDADAAAATNAHASIKFTFGNAVATSECPIIKFAFLSGGWDIAGGTVGSAAVDVGGANPLVSMVGNSVTFQLGAMAEVEGGTQIDISATSIFKFSLIAFADGGVTV